MGGSWWGGGGRRGWRVGVVVVRVGVQGRGRDGRSGWGVGGIGVKGGPKLKGIPTELKGTRSRLLQVVYFLQVIPPINRAQIINDAWNLAR